MRKEQKKLMREQLDATLNRFTILNSIQSPRKGWIRAIRDALGISARQLGAITGVRQSRITRIEQDEIGGSVTLKTMPKSLWEVDK